MWGTRDLTLINFAVFCLFTGAIARAYSEHSTKLQLVTFELGQSSATALYEIATGV